MREKVEICMRYSSRFRLQLIRHRRRVMGFPKPPDHDRYAGRSEGQNIEGHNSRLGAVSSPRTFGGAAVVVRS